MPAVDFKYFADIYLKLDQGRDQDDVQDDRASMG